MPRRDDLLALYFNDHLTGAAGARELAMRSARENVGTPLGDYLLEFVEQLDQERGVVSRLIHAVGGTENIVKQALSWLGEKAERFKLNGQLVGYSPLSRVLELELLLAGVNGKTALWRSLQLLSARDARLAVANFDALEEQAHAQQKALEEHRRAAVLKGFEPSAQEA
jgi:hypothetical protein